MADFTEAILLLRNLISSSSAFVQAMVGQDQREFSQRFVEILEKIAAAKRDHKEDQLPEYMRQLVELGLSSAAKSLFLELIAKSQQMASLESFRVGMEVGPDALRRTSKELMEAVSEAASRGQLIGQRAIPLLGGDVTAADRGHLGQREKPSSLPDLGIDNPGGLRYLNAGFFPSDTNQLLPIAQPLLLQGHYRLGVNIGKFWGPGTADIPIPDDVLAPAFERESVLSLEVAARSLDIGSTPPTRPLQLSKVDDSGLVYFDLTLGKTGRQSIDVDLIYHGHLLQSRRVEVEVLADASSSVPHSERPVQHGYITFTRTAALDLDGLAPLAASPSQLTIVAERDLDPSRIGLRFYSPNGQALGFLQNELTDASLTKVMVGIRKQMAETMLAYSGGIGSTREILGKHLGLLAAAGRTFYRYLLPGLNEPGEAEDQGQRLNVELTPGMVIQVAPLSSQLGVPWELLYERKIGSYHEGITSLCATFSEHGPALSDCPNMDDPNVVCPHGFWGYRYVIEQLPRRIAPNGPLPAAALPLTIRNRIPLRFAPIVFSGFPRLSVHLQTLRNLATPSQMDLAPAADTLVKAHDTLAITLSPPDVIYFYTHGGNDDLGSPYLEIGVGEQIKEIDLDAWGVRLYHQPLVMLNACDSAGYSPDSFENIIKFLCDRGAAGVIGTQCEIKESLADTFSGLFFHEFLKQMPAGRAMYEARQTLLRKHLDPRGLVYSLFAAADMKLAERVID